MSIEPRNTYEPNPVLRALYARFFDRIQVDEAWVKTVRELSSKGTVVYVLRNLNPVDVLALDHLTRRYGLPEVRFANDLRMGILDPTGKGLLDGIFPGPRRRQSDDLRDAIENGSSATLCLKRPPGMLDVAAGASGGRGLKEGDELIETLINIQRRRDTPVLLVPQVIIWSNRPDTRGTNPLDWFLGPREWPSSIRTIGQFLYNYKHVALRAGEPLDLKEFLEKTDAMTPAERVRRVTYALLRRLERERRSVTGPAGKPPDRIRHEIVRSPKLRSQIADLAGDRPEDQSVLMGRALGMLREMQAAPNAATIKALELMMDRVFHRIYRGIDYPQQDIERLRSAAKEGAIILLPSHKSHIDYLLLSYVFQQEQLPLPHVAAGDNLSFFPLGSVFRRGGAFFIRRSFKGDPLYGVVVDAYIRRLIRDGFPLEFFLEGGRSRTGKLLPPKFGLLKMVIDAALGVPHKRVYFVPISIGYERVVESGSYTHELAGGEKAREDAAGLVKSASVLQHRYGRINLQVGHIMTLDDIRDELGLEPGEISENERRALVTKLGNRVMDEINRVAAVTPGALTALAALSHSRRGLPHEELLERCQRLLETLRGMHARISDATATSAGKLRPEAMREAAQMFVDAEMMEAHAPADTAESLARRRRGTISAGPGAIYTIPPGKRLALDTSKNIIVHFFVERALVAIAMTVPPGPTVGRQTVRDRVYKLSRLFKFEFRFHADASFDEIFENTLETMRTAGEVEQVGDHLDAGPGREGWSGREWLETYASILRNFVEGYRVAARGLGALVKGPVSEKDLVKKALAVGNRMFLAGEIERNESVSKPIIANAYLSLKDQGYLHDVDGKVELAESFRTQQAVRAIEGRIAGYLDADVRAP